MRLIPAIVALSLLATPVLAASATGSASVTILRPITVSQSHALTFGNLQEIANSSANVSMSTSGQLTANGVTPFGPHSQAIFTIAGEPNSTVDVAIDPTVTLTGPNSVTVIASTVSDAPAPGLILSGTGGGTVNVGASFILPGNAPSGVFTGSFTVTANYQ